MKSAVKSKAKLVVETSDGGDSDDDEDGRVGSSDLSQENSERLTELSKRLLVFAETKDVTQLTLETELAGAVKLVAELYPSQSDSSDPVSRLLQNADPEDVHRAQDYELWWASKKLVPSQPLQDYAGRNEKTKLIIKLQKVYNHYSRH